MIEQTLLDAIRSSWAPTTAAGDNQWSPDNPAAGHCDVTALVIREHLGGDIKIAHVFRDGEFSEHHYWNVLPDQTELDVTADQFDGTETQNEITTMDAAFFATAGPMNAELTRRLDIFREAVAGNLASTA